MPKWEYSVKDSYRVPLEEYLNEMGKEGWELVSIISKDGLYKFTRLVFKRQYIEEQSLDKEI